MTRFDRSTTLNKNKYSKKGIVGSGEDYNLLAIGDSIIAAAGFPPLGGFPLLPQPLRALFGIRSETFDKVARDEIDRHKNSFYVPIVFDPKPEKYAADGFHLSEARYREFGKMMATRIVERLKAIELENA